MPIEYALPEKDDPQFQEKLLIALRNITDELNRPARTFTPIKPPEDGNQHGDVFFDTNDNKLKVVTPNGTQVVKYE